MQNDIFSVVPFTHFANAGSTNTNADGEVAQSTNPRIAVNASSKINQF